MRETERAKGMNMRGKHFKTVTTDSTNPPRLGSIGQDKTESKSVRRYHTANSEWIREQSREYNLPTWIEREKKE